MNPAPDLAGLVRKPDRRMKPCAACGHRKTIHRVGKCCFLSTRRARAFEGGDTYVVRCQCPGYEPITEGANR